MLSISPDSFFICIGDIFMLFENSAEIIRIIKITAHCYFRYI
ncbi:hypothetical protein DSBG_3783 [Desulfosporosinus sp. BG]|nr:hypothetical protein DSBG_3783 [Desulfosporosinus sp. BG]